VISRTDPAVRDPDAVREAVDARLPPGEQLPLPAARERLNAVERVEWALGELLVNMFDRSFHLWAQAWCLDASCRGPEVISVIAEEGRTLDPVVAELLRWTARWGLWARTGERGQGLVSVIPEVWLGAWDQVEAFRKDLVSRWPEGLDPFGAPAPKRWQRTPVPRAASAPWFPQVLLDPGDSPTPESIVESAAHALWRAGAAEDDLDVFFAEASQSGDAVLDVLAQWVPLDAAKRTALKAELFPPDALAGLFAVRELKSPFLGLVSKDREDELVDALAGRNCPWLDQGPVAAVEQVLAALREDPDVIILPAAMLDPGAGTMLERALQSGHGVVVVGTGPAVDAMAARAEALGIPLLRA
jgi:hypothetical protein